MVANTTTGGNLTTAIHHEFAGNGLTHCGELWATHTLGSLHYFAATFPIKHFEFKFNLLVMMGTKNHEDQTSSLLASINYYNTCYPLLKQKSKTYPKID